MKSPVAGALVAVWALSGLAVAGPDDSAVKCARGPILFPDAPEPVYVVDARSVDRDSLPSFREGAVESVEVVCADYLYATFGIKARQSGIVIFTAPGPRAALALAMDSIASLQNDFLIRTGAFAESAEALGWLDEAGLITVNLTISEDGTAWTASGTHKYLARQGVAQSVGGSKERDGPWEYSDRL